MIYLWAFIIGGLWCVLAQILIDKTRMTPARILVSYVVLGVILTAAGWYEPLVKLSGNGATTPLVGFGYSLVRGVEKAVDEKGILGAFTGGLTGTAGGLCAVMLFGLLAAIFFRGKRNQ